MSSKNSANQQRRIDNYQKGMEREDQKRQLRKNKKTMRRNLAPKKARRKDWLDVGDWDEAEHEDFERIMPRDESDRRSGNVQNAPAVAGEMTLPDSTGRVIEVSKGLCRVQLDDDTLLCSLRGSLNVEETGFTNAVAVGDEVLVQPDGGGGGVVEMVLPRRNLLTRPDVFLSHLRQVIVANADQLLIVASWRNPHLWPELIDRYLVVAARNDMEPILCVNKVDLADDPEELKAALQAYRALDVTTVLTSTITGAGIPHLRALLADQTTVLAGLSGVGKSSLISAVEPGLQLRTSAVSETSGDGRHTTTQAIWLPLAGGGAVVDTPGIREFGLSDLAQPELVDYMPDVADVATGCRFADCRHLNEPDCAVRAAVAAGELAETRYHSYRQIITTLPEMV
jgi:ribosome biogenesis GTPase / thiamine phosphate phosphatase